MKKKTLIIVVIILSSFTRCTDYLERQPLDQPSSETFMQNETEVMMAVNACYNFIDNNNNWASRVWARDLVNLEDAGQVRMSARFNGFRTGNISPTDGMIGTYYEEQYKGISRAHITVEGMERAREVMEAEGKLDLWNRLRSEARVIRAYNYYNLVTKFGDVPLTRNQLEMTEYANLERTDEDEIYEYIFEEIDDAAQYLPASYGPSEAGRITKGAAYAIGAKAAIYRAFFYDGKAITPDNTMLTKARDYTQMIIDSGAHELYYDSDDPKNSYHNLFSYKGENSKEAILQKEFNFAQGRGQDWNIQLASRNYPNGFSGTSPQEYLIHTYEDTLGNTVDKSPYYNPRNPFFGRDPRLYQTVGLPRVEGDQEIEVTLNTANGPKTLYGWNEVYPGTSYPDINNPNLTREYNTLLQTWGEKYGKDLANWDWYTDENGVSYLFGNQDATNPWSSRTGYLTIKYLEVSDWPGNQQNSSLNFMIIRYADVLLMNAEARIELNDGLATAAEYINMVRARGYGMTPGEYESHPSQVDASAGQAELRRIVRRERKVELCFEGIRYDDLKRYGAAVKALNQDVVGRPKYFHLEAMTNIPQIDDNAVVTLPWLDGLNPQLDEYPNRWWMFSDYKEHFNLWPIPQSEFDNGKALGPEDQNPGYLGG